MVLNGKNADFFRFGFLFYVRNLLNFLQTSDGLIFKSPNLRIWSKKKNTNRIYN